MVNLKRVGTTMALVVLLAGCAATQPVKEVTQSGFLGDYSLLHPGAEGEAVQVYMNPNADWAAYQAVLIDPVTVWLGPGSPMEDIPQAERQQLANSLHAKIVEALQSDYEIVSTPGPGVLRIAGAITDAKDRNVTMDTISTFVPQARVISQLKSMATGTQAFVGRASVEGRITDAATGTLLFAAVDERAGGKTVSKGFDDWADVEAAYTYWAARLRYRLCQERGGTDCTAPEG